jgi:inner membrane protein
MPGVLHAAVGLAAGRVAGRVHTGRLMVVLALLALLPDLDALALAFGIPYRAPFGHRGAFHSLAAALLVGGLCSFDARAWQMSRLRMFGLVSAVVASHGLLDALTDGGLGIALAWPLTNERMFSSWRPMPVAPIGGSILSRYGQHVLLTELVLSCPLLLYAFWPRRVRLATQRLPIPARSGGHGWSAHVQGNRRLPRTPVWGLHPWYPAAQRAATWSNHSTRWTVNHLTPTA